MPVLTGIDVLGVQRFVFSSNRLKDVVAGSYLVEWSTSREGALLELLNKGWIEKDDDILLASGANAFIVFTDKVKARTFAAEYTRLLYDKAPGVEVIIVHEEISKEGLVAALQKIQKNILPRKKTERIPSVPLAGVSVTATCMETGFTAVDFAPDENNQPISRNIAKRRQDEIRNKTDAYWKKCLLKGRDEFDFPLNLEELGRTVGDTSLIGVVHVDGNGVGELIKNWLNEKAEAKINDDLFRQEYKEWSGAIDRLGKASLEAVIARLCNSVDTKNGRLNGKPDRLRFDLKSSDDRWMLPVRPILLGGDDLTFVCDGRIALDLAETALCVFESELSKIPYLGQIRACAGVSIVRVRSPFIRAYQFAEQLCQSAKMKAKESGSACCALDWHIGIARPGQALSELRKKQYHSGHYELTCRPYCFEDQINKEQGHISWQWLSHVLLDDDLCGLRGKVWAERRNKVMNLQELVHDGPKIVESALEAWQVIDNKLQFPAPVAKSGFIDNQRTPLLDAVELLDLHLKLGNKEKKQETKKEDG